MTPGGESTALIRGCIERLLVGDDAARAALIEAAARRLTLLARRMLRNFPGVARWEEADDVLQRVLLRLDRALGSVIPPTPRDFFRLSAAVTRRELIGLARHYGGPLGMGAHHSTVGGFADQGEAEGWAGPDDDTHDPGRLALWTEFHGRVEALPDDQREVFDLLWYQGMDRSEAAAIVGVHVKTIQRRWSAARRSLHDAMEGRVPS